MTSREIARIESSVKIRSEEELIQKCKEAGIPRSWYSLNEDRSCPVNLHENTVTYGIMGKTICNVPLCVYDVMFEKLLDYKKDYDFEQSGDMLRIDEIFIPIKKHIYINEKVVEEYPYVLVETYSCSTTPEHSFLDAGWEASHYDQYMAYYVYKKKVDIREIITDIQISFTKRTEVRDADAWGITQMILPGCYRYKIPEDLLEEVAVAKYNRLIPEGLRKKIIERYADCIIDDEYKALSELETEYLKALEELIVPNMSMEEQRKVLQKAGARVRQNNRAYHNLIRCRWSIVRAKAEEDAKKQLGI